MAACPRANEGARQAREKASKSRRKRVAHLARRHPSAELDKHLIVELQMLEHRVAAPAQPQKVLTRRRLGEDGGGGGDELVNEGFACLARLLELLGVLLQQGERLGRGRGAGADF